VLTTSAGRFWVCAIAIASAAALWACASGGGITGTSIVYGPISGFGSIIVNGIEFDTTNAEVTVDGDPATPADLALGMIVVVHGKVDRDAGTGDADLIGADHLLFGPVEAVNTSDGTFVAMSQLVITDAETVFEGTAIEALASGDVVEIFGVVDADLSIRATRVELQEEYDAFELTGTITDLDDSAKTFRFGLLTVDYSAAVVEGAPEGGLVDGLFVEAETDEAPVGDVLTAISIEVQDRSLGFEPGARAEVQGFVTHINSATEFVLNGLERVQITDSTLFKNGTRDDLVINAKLEASGELLDDGTLAADEIEFLSTAQRIRSANRSR
jgi:hypothetical protein